MAFNKNRVMDTARRYVEKGQVDKAIKEYQKVVKEDPKDVRVWLKIGDLFAKKGARSEAIETYLKVAKFYSEQGFDLKAVAVYKQILKLDPRLIEVNLKLAELYRQMGLMKEAMEQFEAVASHFHREGKTREALATVRQLVDLDPENVATRIKLAELYSKEGMVGEAVSEFSKACDYLRSNNRQDDFVKVAERLLWHKPDNIDLSRELADVYLRRNDPRRALQKLQLCFKANSRDVQTLALLAQAFEALEQGSKTVQVLKELARVYDEDNKRDQAKEVHRKILTLAPGDPDSTSYLDGSQASARPPSSPVQQLAMANYETPQPHRRKPNPTGSMPLVDPRSLPGVDFGDSKQENPEILVEDDFTSELTEDSYDSSIEGEMYSEEIAKILTDADVYIRYGLHQKAIDHLRSVFDLDPENVEAREQLKDILLGQGQEAEALEELIRLAELTALRNPDRAEAYLREVLSIDGTYQPAFDVANRFHLNLTAGHGIEIVDEYDNTNMVAAGQVAPIDDVLGLDDVEYDPPAPDPYDFRLDSSLDDTSNTQRPPEVRDPSAVTMELSMEEVESIVELVDDGEFPFGAGPDSSGPVGAADYTLEQGSQFADPLLEPMFDPAAAARFDAEPGYPSPPGGPLYGEEPIFDPLDAAAFDAERESAAREFEAEPITASEFETPDFDSHEESFPAHISAPTDEFSARDFDAEPATNLSDYAVELERTTDLGQVGGYAVTGTTDVLAAGAGQPGSADDDLDRSFTDSHTVDTGLDVLEEKIISPIEQTASGIEDDLDEADFFVSQGLYDEAYEIISNLLASYPEHPLLIAKLRDIESMRDVAASNATRDAYVPASELNRETIAHFERGIEATEGSGLYGDIGKQPTVLLENPVDDEDADTHYDLGLAYKEMGLYDEAVKAFKKVLQVPGREVQCRLMIGLCQREQNQISEAIHQFKAGLHAPDIVDREMLSLYYEIATSYEVINDPKEALYFYRLILKKDPNYRDVPDRAARIEDGLDSSHLESGAIQVSTDDPDAVLDSLLAESELPGRRGG